VPSQGKNSAGSAADWLLEPTDPGPAETEPATSADDFVLDENKRAEPRKQPEPVATDAAQWLVEREEHKNGRGTEKEAEPADEEAAKPVPDPVKRADSGEARAAERALDEERERNADLARRISELEAELRAQSERAEATLSRTLDEREAEFAAALRERDEALNERKSEFEDQVSRRYEDRKSDLTKEFDERQAELEGQLTTLEMRLDVREEELREQAGRREAKLENRVRELQEQLADAKLGTNEAPSSKRPRRRSAGKNGELDVNDVSFEQLREVGLSITQSARVIAYRDTRGGFDSLDELDEIPGLPKETRGTLKDLLTL
jgi:DNA uptake protein ComE-like DNA-binding protein